MKHWKFPFWKEELEHRAWELSATDRLFMELIYSRHNIAQLVALQTLTIEGQEFEVIRYDGCHGSLHRHLLFERPERREELGWPLTKETRHRVIDDLKQHWVERREKFLRKIGGKDQA